MKVKAPLVNLAQRFIGTPLMVHPPKMKIIVEALAPRLGLDVDHSALDSIVVDERMANLMSHYAERGDDRSFALVNGVAIIPVQGTLLKRCTGFDAWSGCCSYLDIQDQIAEAVDDAAVSSILLDIDSPGGEVSGCFELSDYIYSIRGVKPIYSISNDCAASAAYAIASSTSKVFVTRTGAVGSIGVFALHADQVELDKKIGVKYTYIFAGAHKVDGNPHEPLSERANNKIKTEIDREYDIFTTTVARNRGVDVKDVVATEADLFWGDSALPMLADAVGTFDDVMNELTSGKVTAKRSKSAASAATTEKGETNMVAKKATPEADEEEMKKKGDKEEDCDPDMKSDPKDGKDEKDDADEKDETDGGGKKAAKVVLTPAAAGTLVASRSVEDISTITNLCTLANVPQLVGEYLTKKNTAGAFMSSAEVSRDLMNGRAAESEKTSIMHMVDTNNGGGNRLTLDQLQNQATAFARANRTTISPNLYFPGTRKGTTPEQAFAAALESNPEVYASYREQHNAKDLIARLRAAGVKLVTA